MLSMRIAAMCVVAAALVLLALDGAFADPEPCTLYPFDGCRCHTDTMTLDISEYFKYPVVMVGPEDKYNYTYNPCAPFECGPGEPAVLCQEWIQARVFYALGRLDDNTTWYVESYNPLEFTIHYYNGDPVFPSHKRDALVNMAYNNSVMSAKFTSESPILTYHFSITGNKVAVPQEDICTRDPTNNCRCHSKNMTLDISEYFKYPVEMMDGNVYNYTYSPCTPIQCGTESAVVCQYSISQGISYVVARVDSSTTWNVNSYNPLQFTIHYYGGDLNRNAIFNMTYEDSAMSAKFISEAPPLTYHFGITGNKVVPAPASSITPYPTDCITFTTSIVVTMVTTVTVTPTACFPAIGTETELAVTHITTLTLHHSPSPPPPSSTEEEEEEETQEASGLVGICARAGFNKLVLFGALVVLFLILLLPVMVQRRRRFSSDGGGYYTIPSKKKDILY